jgi:diguanylate cyclase (GGDEF)-like protein
VESARAGEDDAPSGRKAVPPPARGPGDASGIRAIGPGTDVIDLEDLLGEPARPTAPPRREAMTTPPSGTVLNIPPRRPPPTVEFVTLTVPPTDPPPPDLGTVGMDECLARIGVGVVETDAAGRITRMNEAAQLALRRSLDDGPIALDDLLHTAQVSASGEAATGDGTDATGWIVRGDGDLLGVRHAIAPREGAEGALVVFRESRSGAVYAPSVARRARYDPLTGLFSRRGIGERVDQALADSRERGSQHALCYIDLDRFRMVNATCGHDAGDDLLQWVATRLYEVLAAADSASRIAGDEFAILLFDHEPREAERVAREIQRRLVDFRFAWGHKTFLVESSIGLHCFGAEADGADDVIAAASHACRLAKKNGGARLQAYLPDDGDMAQSRRSMDWVAGIQHHIASGKLQLFAQTIHPISGRKEQGGHFEILMRVLDDAGRPQSPVGIIQAAENGRVMDSIDRFILRKAFQTIGALPRRALRKLDLFSVNLSAISLAREGLLDFIVEHLEHSQVPPGKVCFEITETTAVANLDEVRWLIQELGAMGCRFAIDDFGSGHASYGYIERLPVDYVKIDGQYVRDMMSNALHRAIVESVNRIATTLGIKTIAECVETADAAEVLAGMGVHYGQGWYYARPAPIADVCKALDRD